MAEQWLKYFHKLPEKVQLRIETILFMLKNWSVIWLDIKQLKWHANIYRVRIGDLRLIYRLDDWEVDSNKIMIKMRCI